MKKRSAKKNNSKKSPKYGLNVYGERCIVKEVEIQKENVLEQYTAIVDDIDAHQRKGIALEYTVTHSKDFTEEEIKYSKMCGTLWYSLQWNCAPDHFPAWKQSCS